MATVHSVCISARKGEKKHPVDAVTLCVDFGIENDAHAGSGRQVSLLALEGVERMREKLATIVPGDFAENLTVAGLNELGLLPGSRVRVGEAVLLEVTQIGKECHGHGCAIMRAVGTCVMPKEGIFARVLTGGIVRPGDAVAVA
ncbi:MOSC domain-containing protein [Desulfovibrio sp. TomC]|uniref:MOSC domain-containing protein n=1 Tax=Desulfovibrio sp. TomC TaxID=1562888 RepID=UPI000574A03E|nr:MOSC domain-containing protein [Desulfovibrio sp. TomC]KHK01735.1 molybdochelatase [Desulfovibrio sp. TomC]